MKKFVEDKKRTSPAFTIVELLVVIAIIAALAAIVLVNVTGYIAKGKRSSVQENLASIQTNAASYYSSNSGTYSGYAADPTFTNPRNAIQNITGSSTVVENESPSAFCACAPLPDVTGSTGQTECVDSTGAKIQSTITCTDACGSTATCSNLSAGLVGYWKLDESSGTTAADSSGNGNKGTYNGTTAENCTTAGNCPTLGFSDPYSRSFNGTSDFIKLATPTILQTLTVTTVSAWIKTTSTDIPSIIFNDSDTNSHGFELYMNSSSDVGKAALWSSTGGVLVGTKTINDGNWHNVVAVLNGTTRYIYIDGVLDVSSAGSADGLLTIDAQIGAQCAGAGSTNCNSFFSGSIDDVRIYNRALSASEVALLYAGY